MMRTLAVTGSDESAAAVGRSIVVQIATLLGPDVCGIEVHARADRDRPGVGSSGCPTSSRHRAGAPARSSSTASRAPPSTRCWPSWTDGGVSP